MAAGAGAGGGTAPPATARPTTCVQMTWCSSLSLRMSATPRGACAGLPSAPTPPDLELAVAEAGGGGRSRRRSRYSVMLARRSAALRATSGRPLPLAPAAASRCKKKSSSPPLTDSLLSRSRLTSCQYCWSAGGRSLRPPPPPPPPAEAPGVPVAPPADGGVPANAAEPRPPPRGVCTPADDDNDDPPPPPPPPPPSDAQKAGEEARRGSTGAGGGGGGWAGGRGCCGSPSAGRRGGGAASGAACCGGMRDEGESRWCGGWCGCCCSGAKVAEEPAPFSLSLGGTATGDTPEPCTLLLATRCSFLSMRSVYSRCELASAQMVSSNLLAISRIFSASARRVSELVNRSITSCEHAARRGKERGSDGGKNERARVFLQRGGKRIARGLWVCKGCVDAAAHPSRVLARLGRHGEPPRVVAGRRRRHRGRRRRARAAQRAIRCGRLARSAMSCVAPLALGPGPAAGPPAAPQHLGRRPSHGRLDIGRRARPIAEV